MRIAQYSVAWAALIAFGCQAGSSTDPGKSRRDDNDPLGLYADFFDGKYDAAGHPYGAAVFEAGESCHAETGAEVAEGWEVRPGQDSPGFLCKDVTAPVGRGAYVVSARALVDELFDGCGSSSDCEGPDLVELRVFDGSGDLLASRTVRHDQLTEEMTYTNLVLEFSSDHAQTVSVEVDWSGDVSMRIDYIELFRASRGLVLSPRSGVFDGSTTFEAEIRAAPVGARLEIACDDIELTDRLDELLEAGAATREQTDFRVLYSAPMGDLFEGCADATRIKARVITDTNWVRSTARVTYLLEEVPCQFEAGKRRVLLTGFEPFPADSSRDNSSEQAVIGFDASTRPTDTVMTMVIPVEWETAAGLVVSAIDRCHPDLVVGFGQGRQAVDIETTAYNSMDSMVLPGGIPDNRGVIVEPTPIVDGGEATLTTRLPFAELIDELVTAGVDTRESDDPGRYICNNIFYAIMKRVQNTDIVAGFIHLPRIASVDQEDKAMLQTVVERTLAVTD